MGPPLLPGFTFASTISSARIPSVRTPVTIPRVTFVELIPPGDWGILARQKGSNH
jgi:hypothetical protein